MTTEEYQAARSRIGTQGEVAKLLGISGNTLSRRELGLSRITFEMELAILRLGDAAPGPEVALSLEKPVKPAAAIGRIKVKAIVGQSDAPRPTYWKKGWK